MNYFVHAFFFVSILFKLEMLTAVISHFQIESDSTMSESWSFEIETGISETILFNFAFRSAILSYKSCPSWRRNNWTVWYAKLNQFDTSPAQLADELPSIRIEFAACTRLVTLMTMRQKRSGLKIRLRENWIKFTWR